MNSDPSGELRKRVDGLRALPSSPAVLQPLLDLLREPSDQVDLKKVVKLVSQEHTIAAQCLRMANSPLYPRSRPAETIQAAVFTLGIQRVQDVLLGHCLNKLVPSDRWATDPSIFWRHSFGCGLVCKELAERIGYPKPDTAYLAGLLHDLGIVVNSLAYTKEFRAVMQNASKDGVPLDEQEQRALGFTHCESGGLLANLWRLPKPVAEAIRWHHGTSSAQAENPLISIVHVGDLLCRTQNLGYGYQEWRAVDLTTDPAWKHLSKHCPKIEEMDLMRFTLDMETFMARVSALVDEVFAAA